MVKKYLCAAPHPSTWSERAEALLKSLGGNKKRREKALRQTLEQLAEEVAEKNKRTGPGRKSNADHAVSFYEYVLGLSEQDEEPEKQIGPAPKPPGGGNGTKQGKIRTKGDDEDPSAEEASILSMTSQEFLDQHNDLCEVCNLGGDLLCCATCNLVFHLKCNRPKLKEEPPDNWSCSYCVASGVTGYKKEARTRRRAAAAVRQMTKNKQQWKEKGSLEDMKEDEEVEEGDDDDGEEGDEKMSPKESSKETHKEPPKESPKVLPKEPPKAPAKEPPNDSKADSPIKVEDAQSRRARHRRPEEESGDEEDTWCNFCKDDAAIPVCCFCACRICFGKHDWSNLLLCDHCDEEYHTYCLSPPISAVPTSKKWYCPTCRPLLKEAGTARSKIETRSTPEKRPEKRPVGRPPNAERRPVGRPPNAERRPVGRPPNAERRPVGRPPNAERRPVGRPPNADRRPVGRPSNAEKRPVGRPPNAERRPVGRPPNAERKPIKSKAKEVALPPIKRGPGRPRKHPLPATSAPSPEKRPVGRPPNVEKRPVGRPPNSEKKNKGKDLGQVPVKRGPGRPRKHPLPTVGAAAQKRTSTGRPRGRPPKNRPTMLEGKPNTTRSSKRARITDEDKKGSENVDFVVTEAGSSPAVPFSKVVQRSRSGRMVKQKTFHDELFEMPTPKRPTSGSASRGPVSSNRAAIAQSKKGATKLEKGSESPNLVMSQAQILKLKSLMAPRSASVGDSPAASVSPSMSSILPIPKPVPPPPATGYSNKISTHSFDTNSASTKATLTNSKRPVLTIGSPGGKLSSLSMSTSQMSDPTVGSPVFDLTSATGQPGDSASKAPRRKPGARECMQISRRFSTSVIPPRYMDILLDYCSRGKVEHLIRMRERLDDHSRFLEAQLAGLEALVKERGETDVVVPAAQDIVDTTLVPNTTTATTSTTPEVARRVVAPKVAPLPQVKPAPISSPKPAVSDPPPAQQLPSPQQKAGGSAAPPEYQTPKKVP